MKCANCQENYGPEFDGDFLNGECLPCRSQRDFEEEQERELRQLERWNQKHGEAYGMDDFHYACPEEIKREDLKGFPLLRDIWDWMKGTRDEEKAELERWERERKAPTLFNEVDNGLPF